MGRHACARAHARMHARCLGVCVAGEVVTTPQAMVNQPSQGSEGIVL